MHKIDEAILRIVQAIYDWLLDFAGIRAGSFCLSAVFGPTMLGLAIGVGKLLGGDLNGASYLFLYGFVSPMIIVGWRRMPIVQIAKNRLQDNGKFDVINNAALINRERSVGRSLILLLSVFVYHVCGHIYLLYLLSFLFWQYTDCVLVREQRKSRKLRSAFA